MYCLTSWSHTPFSSIFRFLGASKLPAFHARGRLKLYMFVGSAPGLLGAGCLTYYSFNGFARGWYKTFGRGSRYDGEKLCTDCTERVGGH